MIQALLLGLRQLSDPAMQRLLVRTVVLAALTFCALFGGITGLLLAIDLTGIGWLDPVVRFAGSALALVLAWLLFPIVIALTLGLLADEVVAVVERRHYPDLPPAPGASLAASLTGALKFVLVAVFLNLLVLPLYLLPGPNIPIYLALNGYLLGREYFELVATRRLPPAAVASWRRRERGRLWLAGIVIAAMLMVPGFNLLAPVVAIGFMVHLFTRSSTGAFAPAASGAGQNSSARV